jgi:hypothetical protein
MHPCNEKCNFLLCFLRLCLGETSLFQLTKAHTPIHNHFLYHILVILVCRIFFCNWNMPYMSASAVGGPIDHTLAVLSPQN